MPCAGDSRAARATPPRAVGRAREPWLRRRSTARVAFGRSSSAACQGVCEVGRPRTRAGAPLFPVGWHQCSRGGPVRPGGIIGACGDSGHPRGGQLSRARGNRPRARVDRGTRPRCGVRRPGHRSDSGCDGSAGRRRHRHPHAAESHRRGHPARRRVENDPAGDRRRRPEPAREPALRARPLRPGSGAPRVFAEGARARPVRARPRRSGGRQRGLGRRPAGRRGAAVRAHADGTRPSRS